MQLACCLAATRCVLLRLAPDCALSWPGMAVWPAVRRPYIDFYCAWCQIVHSANASGLGWSSGALSSGLVVSIPFWPSGHWPHYIITHGVDIVHNVLTLHVPWAGFGSAASVLIQFSYMVQGYYSSQYIVYCLCGIDTLVSMYASGTLLCTTAGVQSSTHVLHLLLTQITLGRASSTHKLHTIYRFPTSHSTYYQDHILSVPGGTDLCRFSSTY
jgi:hypothetical protein